MTDIRRANEPRIRQPLQSVRQDNSYRGSCNSTPEPSTRTMHASTYPADTTLPSGQYHLPGSVQRASVYRNPLLASLTDHINMSSISGGSTSSSGATAIIGRCNGDSQPCELQFDEHGVYYVSPSKRKATTGPPSHGPPTLRAACERIKPSPATIAPSHPAIKPSAAYGARTAGQGHGFSFDGCDIAPRYSDTAMQLLRSGSSSTATATGLATGLITSSSTGNCNSSDSSSTQRQRAAESASAPLHRASANVVTFLSPVDDQRPAAHSRGSLRRSKGRSSQSLCSCDADTDTEINPDPTRPLYQYSLERRNRGHTYTCEQNAQILLRLGRERNRKLGSALREDGQQSEVFASPEVDGIPPVPPPPATKRFGSMRNLRLQQRPGGGRYGGAQDDTPPTTTTTTNNNNNNSTNSIASLCSSDLLNTCADSTLEVGSMLDDCASSILKCAHAEGSELDGDGGVGGVGGVPQYKSNIAPEASAALIKPDVCHVTLPYGNAKVSSHGRAPHCVRDDITLPNGKQHDPGLCFLHLSGARVAVPAMPHLSKYNTIGPSSDCARQFSGPLLQEQQQQQRQWQQLQLSAHCRCLSQSLSNFTRDYFGAMARKERTERLQREEQQRQQHHIFYTGDNPDERNWLKEPPPPTPPPPPFISRSYGDLMAAGAVASNRSLFMQSQTPAASAFGNSKNTCSLDLNSSNSSSNKLINNSFATLTATASSGLKDNLQHQHQEQHHHHQHQHHHQQHQHQQPQPQQHQAAGKQQQQSLHASLTSIMPWKHRQCPSRCSSSSGTNSFRFDAVKHWLAVSSILLIIGAASVGVPLALRVAASAPFEERLRVALQLLDQVPLIDGHNDLPWNIRKFLHNKLNDFNFDEDLRNVNPWAKSQWSHTDLQRLKRGRVAAQFWAAYVPCEAQHRDAVQLTLEQIDVIKRLTDRYAPQLTMCTSAEDIREAHKNHQLCSLTGVEGGHSLGGSLAVLRTLYTIGVRYMTLTSTCHTPWADSSYADAPTFNVKHGGLTIFGKTIIREMNRLGMMVDLSHVSTGTMRDALEVSEAPVIFSHSSAYEVCNSSRNVQDDMLQALAKNGGLVMVNFYSKFLSCSDNSTVHDAVAHINHIKRIAGIDHVGLGAGFDGINFTPKGLEDVSSYPTLFAELLGVGWSIDDLAKLAGGNFLRVLDQVEKLRDEKKAAGVKPYEDHPNFRTDDPYNCTSS